MTEKGKQGIRFMILAISIVLLGVGIFTNGFTDVWGKATMICMECIGLG